MDTEHIANWIGAVGLAAIIVGVPTACSVHTNNLKAQAISEGSDPIAVDCAFGMNSGSTQCVISAARLKGTGKEDK